MFLEMGANVAVKIHYFSFIILGVVLALAITLRVIYNVSFKGKRFIGDVKRQMQAHNNAPYVSSQEPPREYPRVAPRPLANDLPPDISEIGENAFAMNTNLKNVLIPEGILYLGAGAFSNCLNLESVTIPHSVRNIGYNCFFNTPKLKEIDYLGTAQEFEMISKGSNWLTLSSAHIVKTRNGTITIDHQ